jgi:hypothetical protein
MAVGLEATEEDRTLAVVTSPGEVIDTLSRWLEGFMRYGTATD